jgi:hypothetical protein
MEADGNIDGSDIFWPGYVDAVTNLVLNLLFMLTILIIAVFMFALELSRHQDKVPSTVKVVAVDDKRPVTISVELTPGVVEAKDIEIQALQKELLTLKKQVQAQEMNDMRNTQKTVIAKTPLAKADKDLDKAAANGGGIVVKFMADAVTLSPTEAESVRSLLAPIVASGSAKIEVIAPAGFSEAKRLGFYRAMAVRNELIEMKLAATKIEVSVREGKSGADNTKVLVSPR